jgi:predicted nucleic acid-binding protein
MRRYLPALTWLRSIPAAQIGIPGIVAMELIQGCRNRQEQQQVENMLKPYALFWPERADCTRALADFANYHLSHKIGLLDALIAGTAVGLGVELATFNSKHYSVITALRTLQPYNRQ